MGRFGRLGSRGRVGCVLAATALSCSPGFLDAIGLAPTTLDDRLIAHYTFDEGDGSIIVDHSGNMHDGVLSGGEWIDSGRFGGAIRFDGGAGSYGTVDDFPNPTSSFSVSAWVRTATVPLHQFQTIVSTEVVFDAGWEINLLGVDDAGVDIQPAYPTEAGYIRADCDACLIPNQWMHVAFVRDAAAQTFSLYVNGTFSTSTDSPVAILPGTPALNIAHWSGMERILLGDIDDVAIYGRALQPAEIMSLYQQPPPDPQ